MPDETTPTPTLDIPGFELLSPEHQAQLLAMAENMRERGLPPPLVDAGLRSTAALLREQQEEATPRIRTERVRRFLDENQGQAVSQRSRATPRRETKLRGRERLQERLCGLMAAARTANRRHDMLRVRREILALDQNYIRRVLGAEGNQLCNEMNAWLIEAATRLNRH